MVRLGLATCQRESDLIRMGPGQREREGLWCRPKKTKKKRKAFCIPLTQADARMLDRWPGTKIAFTASRWKAPIRRGNADFYLFSPRGVPYTETSLRALASLAQDGQWQDHLCALASLGRRDGAQIRVGD
jgi:integrase